MRAIVAKQIRRLAYNKGHHPGPVQYFHHPKIWGVMIADQLRQRYQALKAAYQRGEFSL